MKSGNEGGRAGSQEGRNERKGTKTGRKGVEREGEGSGGGTCFISWGAQPLFGREPERREIRKGRK